MKHLVLVSLALLALAACQSQPDQHTATTTAPLAGQPAPTATEVAATNSPGASYQTYRGLLPGRADSITLHLVTAPQPRYDTHGPSSQGSYYGADGHPYALASQPSNPDSLVLADYSPEHGATGMAPPPTWRLRRQPDGSLAGTTGGQPLRLRPVGAAGGLLFVVQCFADSLAALPKQPATSPKARMYMQALVPVSGPSTVQSALAAGIARELRGDTLDTRPALPLPALYKQQRDAFYKEYQKEAVELAAPAEEEGADSYRASLNYEEQSGTYVLYQQGDLLSLGFFSYSYAGGAHGMSGTTTASYDLRTGRRLRYDDIFQPAAAAQLPALLARAVRPLVGLQPGEALDKALLMKQMPVTHNVYLTAGGVGFVYQPYEIASYAQGEVRVFLPLNEVRGLLRPGLPLPAAPGVAVR